MAALAKLTAEMATKYAAPSRTNTRVKVLAWEKRNLITLIAHCGNEGEGQYFGGDVGVDTDRSEDGCCDEVEDQRCEL